MKKLILFTFLIIFIIFFVSIVDESISNTPENKLSLIEKGLCKFFIHCENHEFK